MSKKKDQKRSKFITLKFLNLILVILIIVLVGSVYLIKSKANLEQIQGEDKYDFIAKNLVGGGPPKDGIPSIDNPIYLNANEANLSDDDIVFGISYNDFVVAYPQDILYWHEIVNEDIDGEKISLTYCPLTGSVIGYKGHELGVSGKLYNSNLVTYDRDTNSRVPQILGEGIEGDLRGVKFDTFPVYITTWKKWKTKYTNTKVLSRKTGFDRDYDKNPYPGYDNLLRVWFPLTAKNDSLRTKDWVFGIENNNDYVAILIKDFKLRHPKDLEIEVGGEKIKVYWDEELGIIRIDKEDEIKHFNSYWFAWYAYHPKTKLII